jgi:hypothetical protein
MAMSQTGWMAVAALKAREIIEGTPDGMPDLAHMTVEQTWDLVKAVKVCSIVVCYIALADLRRHGLMLPP